jgi:hypothetical protein
VGVFVEATEQGLVVDEVPEAVLYFFQPDVFGVEGLAQEVLAGVEPEGPGAADASDFEVAGVFGWRNAFGIGSG